MDTSVEYSSVNNASQVYGEQLVFLRPLDYRRLPPKDYSHVVLFLSQIILAVVAVTAVVAEPPRPFFPGFSAPSAPAKLQQLPSRFSGKQFARIETEPYPPAESYGPPAEAYGPPAQSYGPPVPEKIITKNVYVHVPPEEPVTYAPARQIEVPVPKKHYKIIFIKAPAPPTPVAPVIPEQIQDEHKTLVYVLVKKPEEQPEIEIPVQSTTEPSKPEVFFIKYKEPEKEPQREYGPPKQQYGPPN